MKKIYSISKMVLYPLHQKFTDAGCECTLKKDKHQTILTIRYSNVVSLSQTRTTA